MTGSYSSWGIGNRRTPCKTGSWGPTKFNAPSEWEKRGGIKDYNTFSTFSRFGPEMMGISVCRGCRGLLNRGSSKEFRNWHEATKLTKKLQRLRVRSGGRFVDTDW